MASAQPDTIVALSTPPGRGGIGIVRLSGLQSLAILRKLVNSESFAPQPNMLTLRSIFDPNTGDTLDEALVCFFRAPHSFSGEDVVEFHCHGSPVLLRGLIDAALQLGARMATPGEFCLRAVANRRLKLTEAEAIRDLIQAQTEAGLRQATRQMKGEISKRLEPVKDQLVRIIVRLESLLEFVDDDLPLIEHHEILNSLEQLSSNLEKLAETFSCGKALRDGVRVTIVGRPNVGKSSLFNSLLGRARAIVTEIPGTTRDTITESLSIEGLPIVLTDTAGLRTSTNPIESMGVDRSKREAADSELLILVLDGSSDLTDEDRSVMDEVSTYRQIIALNKSDVPSFSGERFDRSVFAKANVQSVLALSAKTDAGINDLRDAIIQPFSNGHAQDEGLLITNARHYDLLRNAIGALTSSGDLLRAHATEELVLVGLHNGLAYLGEITGETTSDDVLAQIFSTFCIGK